jgi:predicted amidohydrolase YtcJ
MNFFRAMPIILLICTFITLSCGGRPEADLVLFNGKVATVDRDFSIQQAVAVKGDRIVFVGSKDGVAAYIGAGTEVIELDGKLVLPGLTDGHAHMHNLGEELMILDIYGTTSFQQIVEKVAERARASKPGEWIIGGRWDQNDWEEKTFPDHDALSEVSPDNPVFLRRVDGNSAFINQKALDIAGITKDTPDPFGGVIHRKSNGEPSGVLINKAMNLAKDKFPAETEAEYREKLLRAIESCLSVGLTGWHEAGVSPWEIGIYKKLIDEGKLHMRAYAMLGEQEEALLEGSADEIADYFKGQRIEEYGSAMLSVRSIKIFFDGALGSRGAAFYEPYADDPENRGLLRVTPEYITKISKAALMADMGVNTHCIGIRGNRLCLDSYEKALKDIPPADHRFRIEHSQFVREEDIAKFAELGVIPAMQPTHCTSDMRMVPARVGMERAKGAYAWRSFLDAGMVIPCGSDFPVETNNPMLGIYAAVTRQDVSGHPEGGWFPEQRMTIQEAVKGFTIWAAYGAFQEDVLGSIEVGKLADFTVLDKDILTIEPKEILKTRAVYTIVSGKIRYSQK